MPGAGGGRAARGAQASTRAGGARASARRVVVVRGLPGASEAEAPGAPEAAAAALAPVSPPAAGDWADSLCRAVHGAMRGTVHPIFRQFLDVEAGSALPAGLGAVALSRPQVPPVPRPVSLVIAASVPTALGWYGFYKFSVEEELFQMEIRRPGGRATGFGGYGTLLPFVYGVLLSLACRAGGHPAAADAAFEAAGAWILATQINLYVRVNDLCAQVFPGGEPPVWPWWAVLPPPLDVVVGLRQVHFLARAAAELRGEPAGKDAVAEDYFPFIGSERFTLEAFAREPRRWFWFTKGWEDWWGRKGEEEGGGTDRL